MDSKINHRVRLSKCRTRTLSGLRCLAAQQALGALSFQVETWKCREAPQTSFGQMTCCAGALPTCPFWQGEQAFPAAEPVCASEPLVLLVTLVQLSFLPLLGPFWLVAAAATGLLAFQLFTFLLQKVLWSGNCHVWKNAFGETSSQGVHLRLIFFLNKWLGLQVFELVPKAFILWFLFPNRLAVGKERAKAVL